MIYDNQCNCFLSKTDDFLFSWCCSFKFQVLLSVGNLFHGQAIKAALLVVQQPEATVGVGILVLALSYCVFAAAFRRLFF